MLKPVKVLPAGKTNAVAHESVTGCPSRAGFADKLTLLAPGPHSYGIEVVALAKDANRISASPPTSSAKYLFMLFTFSFSE